MKRPLLVASGVALITLGVYLIVVAASLAMVSCGDEGENGPSDMDPVTSRDLYERTGLVGAADIVDLLAACPTDAEGPFIVRHADAPQPADVPVAIIVRVEFSKAMTPASAACWREALKAHGVAEYEGDTEHAHYGTTTAGSSTSTGG